jgi:putative ABC transport system permease protein
VIGVALTVALLASIGSFTVSSAASMTARAISGVPVDWQVQLAPGADTRAVSTALSHATHYTALQTVGYADSSGFSASSGGTVQTTGPGKVLGLAPGYLRDFPTEARGLVGPMNGVLLAQQTAANLHVGPGDTVVIQRVGLGPVEVRVDGVIDLPNADSLFQAVGVPAGTAPQAPPDNVLLLPETQWHRIFDPQAKVRPDSVRTQLHVRLAHDLPADPGAAYAEVQGRARNFEARIAGSGVVGDNLSARLDGARSDALYARVLFLFLGLPGVIVAILLTLAVAASGAERRRAEQALLRTRGASVTGTLRIEALESLVVGVGGALLGIALAVIAGMSFASVSPLSGTRNMTWAAGAALAGLFLAALAVLGPAWISSHRSTIAASRAVVGRGRKPMWQRLYLDLIFLAVSALAFWQTASSGYQVVLAPEGVPQTSVAYQSFLGPVFFWIGAGLLTVRVWEALLGRNRAVSGLLRPVAHGLSGVVAASLGRQRLRITRGLVLVALAISFAVSTAVFNTTYNAQSHVDAQLTNGADVAVTSPTASPAGSKLAQLRVLPGVAAAQPMQHRFAYVGNDLQDLYGIDPRHISEATPMSNAYFAGGNARATLSALANTPDGVLVSEETVRDFQLNPGDRLNLRLQSAGDNRYRAVPFHFVGVVREFPTAPTDSFLVANSAYIAARTGNPGAETVLLRTSGDPATVAGRARSVVASVPGARVTDLGSAQRTISSSLTSVNLRGLTRLELAFAVLMLAGAAGLVLALGLAERRRTFSILSALGAEGSQLGSFLWSEGLLILAGGAVIGAVVGFGVAEMLVQVLKGVFDPPPESLSVPWIYLLGLLTIAILSTVGAVLVAQVNSRRPVIEAMREI